MKISKDRFNERVHSFVWERLIPDSDGLATKCALGGLEKVGLFSIDNEKAEALAAIGIVDKDGNVETDQLRKFLYGAAEAGGGVVVVKKFGMTANFPRPMIDKFFAFVEEGAKQ